MKYWEGHFWIALAIVLLVTIWSTILYQQSSFASGVTATSPCDKVALCDYFTRVGYDTSWLCCEDAFGWPATHVLSSMALMLLSNHFWFSFSLVAFWEFIESFALEVGASWFQSISISPQSFNDNLNTDAGREVGRLITLDLLGILLGILLINLTGWTGLNRKPMTSHRVPGKYWFWAIITVAVWLLPFLQDGNFNYGFIIAAVAELLIVIFIWPWVLKKSDVPPDHPDPHEEYDRLKWWWFAVIIVVGVTGPGYIFLFNAIYQAWLGAYIMLIILMVMVLIVPYVRRRSTVRRRAREEEE
jgi:hypothetical protein